MQIQFLYFDDCPNHEIALHNLTAALQELRWSADIEKIHIVDDLQADHYSFQGSPSIKFNGVDLWEEKRAEYHIICRVYMTPTGLTGSPTIDMLVKRLAEMQEC